MSVKLIRGGMRLLLLTLCMSAAAVCFSQKVTLSFSNTPLPKVLDAISKQTGMSIVFKDNLLKDAHPVTIDIKDATVEEALKECLKSQPFVYQIIRNTIVIQKESPPPAEQGQGPSLIDVEGMVLSETGPPVAGATVMVKGTKRGTLTNEKGQVLLQQIPPRSTLAISSIGYETREVRLGDQTSFSVKLKVKVSQVAEVEVVNNGMFTRKKESFTGAAVSYTGEQLKAIGNQNAISSLATLDPTFVTQINNAAGSNPNTMPSIEVRGKTTISSTQLNDQFASDPNQPLFILDGFESTLQQIYDLDMNRIASITILKDAASTALYGAKAANGVVVVETKRPVPGELRISYTGDFDFQIPDLSSYNLMDAKEKLQFEQLAGAYTGYNSTNQYALSEEYTKRLMKIDSGVNTYWLSAPLHLGFTNRHSIQLNGGNRDLMFTAGGNYARQSGVMKGSGRTSWGGNIDLNYRKGKFNVVDILTVNGYTSNESPYGSFSSFATANPYYKKTNPDGTVPMLLDTEYNAGLGSVYLYNPLYNAGLYQINQTKYSFFSNSLQGIVSLTPDLRLTVGGLLSQGNTNSVVFIPPNNTVFYGIAPQLQGSYTNMQGYATSYDGNAMLTYGRNWYKSQLTVNARADIQQQYTSSYAFSVSGFPLGSDGDPSFSYGYAPYSYPATSIIKTRNVGFLGSANYAYDQRYLADLTYRLDGTSIFGSNKVYKPFVSAGLGWNLAKEKLFRDKKWIQMLKIRGDLGYTANTNLGNFTSVSTFGFQTGLGPFGQGLNLLSLGNPNLGWEKSLQGSYGVDFTLWNNRITGYVEYFNKKTDPLVISASGTVPSSVAVNENYEMNIGTLSTKGVDFNLRVSPVYNLKQRIVWTIGITGQAYKERYGGLGNQLANLNKTELADLSLNRFQDGYSPDDIWAVKSRGIDPSNGQEIFENLNGSNTYTYDPTQIRRVGNTDPVVEGVINSTIAYHNWTLGLNFRYRIGGDIFNTDLYNKVENISSTLLWNNQDKRALYDRWQTPGQVAQYKAITNTTYTPMSSRFVQLDNQLLGESINLGWRSTGPWVRKMGMQSLSFNCYLNDLFWWESIQLERGTDYPFARAVALSINASF